jgi:hypothetical protein
VAITSISRIQHRRGLKTDLPTALAEGEFGWCLDTRELFIGNTSGFGFNTQVLTQWSNNSDIIKNTWSPLGANIISSINRPIGEKLNDFVSIKDFGVIGDGVTDDTAAINAAIADLFYAVNELEDSDIPKHVVLYFPAGVYIISDSILLYPYVSIVGAGIDKTIIRCAAGTTQTSMAQTVDSVGATGANIGLNGYYPKHINISDLTFDTNGNHLTILEMTRYQNCKIDTVKFKGGYQLGDGLLNSFAAVTLNSIGNTGITYTIDFLGCIFTNVTYCVYSDDPVKFTGFTRCTFTQCWSGMTLGLAANFNGPYFTTLNQCRFYDIDEMAIKVLSTNPGEVSTQCQFMNCNLLSGAEPVYWGPGTTDNDSIGDVFV